MAELILTEEEKSAALWSDLPDEALGKLLKKKILFLESAAEQLDRTVVEAAAMLLCCYVAENNASLLFFDLDGLSQAGRVFGDWKVTVQKIQPPELPSDQLASVMQTAYQVADLAGHFDVTEG